MTDGYESSVLITRRVTAPVVLAVSAVALLAGPGVAPVVLCERQFRTRLASWGLARTPRPRINYGRWRYAAPRRALEPKEKVDSVCHGTGKDMLPPHRDQRLADPIYSCLTAEMSSEMLTLSPTSTLPLPSA